MTSKNGYSEKFKRDSVRLSEKYEIKVAAKKLGVSVSCLYRWRRTYLNPKAPIYGEHRSYDDLLKDIKVLKRELRLANNAFYANTNSNDLIAKPSRRFKLIQMTIDHDNSHSIEELCEQFKVSMSGFYKWKIRQNKDLTSRKRKEKIKKNIKRLFDESNGTYGAPQICNALKASKKSVSENTVAKYMKEMGLNASPKKKENLL
ncbi:MAG: IS3 family transposase [Proteobacteria bacterium]|nr:IS3 family transposase [Pseudomonadota bacterium]